MGATSAPTLGLYPEVDQGRGLRTPLTKKPAFRDWYIREMTMACIEQGYGDHDGMLLALKQSEKQRYVRLRDGTATAEDRWPLSPLHES